MLKYVNIYFIVYLSFWVICTKKFERKAEKKANNWDEIEISRNQISFVNYNFTLRILPQRNKIYVYKKVHTWILITALFRYQKKKKKKPTRISQMSIYKRIDNQIVLFSYKGMKCHPAMERNKLLMHVNICMTLTGITLNEKIRREMYIWYYSFMWSSRTDTNNVW